MRLLLEKIGAISLGLVVLAVGFANLNLQDDGFVGNIQSGNGKMAVLYNGKESKSLDFGEQMWVPGETRSISVDIRNEGEIAFTSSMTTGDYPSDSIINEFNATITDEAGKTVFQGAYADIEVNDIEVLVGDSEKFKISVEWLPSKTNNSSKERTGQFGWNVSAMQKV